MIPETNVGIDIIEISRFKQKPFKKNKNLYDSLFTESEILHCLKYSDPYPHFAGIFSAKEAIIKCINKSFRMTDIEIVWNNNGKPRILLRSQKAKNISISISHSQSIAIAIAISS